MNGRDSLLSLTGINSSNSSILPLRRGAPSVLDEGGASLSTSLSTPSATPALVRYHRDQDGSDTEATELLVFHSPHSSRDSSHGSGGNPQLSRGRGRRDSVSSTEEFAL